MHMRAWSIAPLRYGAKFNPPIIGIKSPCFATLISLLSSSLNFSGSEIFKIKQVMATPTEAHLTTSRQLLTMVVLCHKTRTCWISYEDWG